MFILPCRNWIIKVQYFGNPILENQKIQGIIILVLDITERERTERMRKEFSANVSHELKTPLTSISGFAELMENHLVGISEDAGVCRQNTQGIRRDC